MSSRNPFEQKARAEKTLALLPVLVRYLPARDAQDAYRLVLAMGAEHWDAVTQEAGVNPPSATTRALIVEQFRRLARESEMAVAS